MFPPGKQSFLSCDSTYLLGGKIMIFIPPGSIFMSIFPKNYIYPILLSVVVRETKQLFWGENSQNGRGGNPFQTKI